MLFSNHYAAQRARLRLFLRWMAAATTIFAIFETLLFLSVGDPNFGLAAIATLSYLAAVLAAQHLVRHGRARTAVVVVSVALLLLALVGVLLWPELQAMIITLPLLAAILALPYLRGQPLKNMLVGAWAVLASIAILAEVIPAQSSAPTWVIGIFRASSLSAAAGLLLLLLWIFSSRMNETLRDISQAHTALRESEARFRATFEQAAVGIAHVSPDGRWLRVNQRLCEILGYSREDLVRRTFHEITHPADLERNLLQVQRLLSGEIPTYVTEKRYIRKTGQPIWILLTVSLVRDTAGRPDYFITVLQDISERKRMQEERDRMYGEMQQALHARDEFFRLAAHELKTPMTTILGSAQLLQRRAEQAGTGPGADTRTTRALVVQARRLYRIVTGLLDLAQIQQGRLTINRSAIDIRQIGYHLLDELQPSIAQHTINATISDQPLLVFGDKLRLETILQNLLQNAIKYSPGGGSIFLNIARKEQSIVLEVADSGIGIPGDALPHIFERFYRAANVDRAQISGMGIGLYIVKELVALHGGAISVTSEEGRGSIFHVVLPAYDSINTTETAEEGRQVRAETGSDVFPPQA